MKDSTDVPCGTCRLCCRGDVIMLIPEEGDDVSSYEHDIVTLPGVGTGAILKKNAEGNCVYLGPQGCTIHDRAPKICRVFDCRRWFLSKTGGERRRLVASGMADADIFKAGQRRAHTLPDVRDVISTSDRSGQ